MGDRIGRHHDGGGADAGVKIGRDLRQQRIRHPHLRLAGEAGDGEQHDGARRHFTRRLLAHRISAHRILARRILARRHMRLFGGGHDRSEP